MNPIRIRGEGYGRFDRFDLELPEGMVAIVGPNGAGKSRLLGVIELALFAGRGELQQWLAPDHERLLIELEFEHIGETYRVRRTYQAGSRAKQTVDFERAVFCRHDDPDNSGLCIKCGCVLDEGDDHLSPRGWEPLTREDAKATDALIVETLGLSRATFNASAFLAQGDSGNFAEATPAARKVVLGEILDPHGLWPRLAERAKTDAREAESVIALRQHDINIRQTNLEALPEVERDVALFAEEEHAARLELRTAERVLEEAQQAVVENAAADERVRALTAAKAHAQTERDRVAGELAVAKGAGDALAEAERSLKDLSAQAALVPELERQAAEQQQARDRYVDAERTRREFLAAEAGHRETVLRLRREGDQLGERHTALTRQLVTLRQAKADTERCDRCKQLLGIEAQSAAIESLTREIDELEAQVSAKVDVALDEERFAAQAAKDAGGVELPDVPAGDFTTALTHARAEQVKAAALEERVHDLGRQAFRLPELTRAYVEAEQAHAQAAQELASAAEQAPDGARLAQAVEGARGRVAACRSTVDEAMHGLVRARQQLEQLAETKRELEALERERDRRQQDLDVLKLAERAFGRDGIPALIAENAIPAIEAKANEILELMPTAKGETLRVELHTQRELKTADHLRETLDIIALDAHGARPYETYSGGEKGRLNVALRLALAQLLAHRRGAESRVLCLDEVEYLDQLGQEQLVDVVSSVGDAYDRVLVVSHAAGVRDAFETVLEIASDPDGVSYIVGAGAKVEAIAA